MDSGHEEAPLGQAEPLEGSAGAPPTSPLPAPPTGTRGNLAGWLRASAPDLLIVGVLVPLAVLVILLNLEGISSGGDAIRKWHFVRQWSYANDFAHAEWNHHMARFGVNGVAYVTQLLLGRGPGVYYVAPITAAVVQAVCVYGCGKRLGGRWAGFLGAMLLIYFKGTWRAASQLLPEIFSGTYAIVATYLYLRYTDATGRRRLGYLIAMGAAMVVDYLAKETSVFFMPGFVVAIWLANGRLRDRVRDIGVFMLVFAIGGVLETAFYRLFTDYAHRFAVIVANHIPGKTAMEAKDFWDLFHRYSKLDVAWAVAIFSFLSTSIGVVGFSKTYRTTGVFAVIFGYFVFLTFLVRRLNPMVVWQSFIIRYLDPTIPFIALVTGLFLALSVGAAWERHGGSWLARKLAPVGRFGSLIAVIVAILAGSWSYTSAKPTLERNALKVTQRMATVANDAYRRNLPIVSVSPDRRGVWVVYAVLLDDRLLARGRQLPDFEVARRVEPSFDYLVRDPSSYTADKVRALMKRGCAIETRTMAGRPVTMRPLTNLPADCNPQLSEP
jgi:hypothetical protein